MWFRTGRSNAFNFSHLKQPRLSTSLYDMVTPSPNRDSSTFTPTGSAGNWAAAEAARANRARALEAAIIEGSTLHCLHRRHSIFKVQHPRSSGSPAVLAWLAVLGIMMSDFLERYLPDRCGRSKSSQVELTSTDNLYLVGRSGVQYVCLPSKDMVLKNLQKLARSRYCKESGRWVV